MSGGDNTYSHHTGSHITHSKSTRTGSFPLAGEDEQNDKPIGEELPKEVPELTAATQHMPDALTFVLCDVILCYFNAIFTKTTCMEV